MRRLALVVLVLLVAAVPTAGCAGAEGRQAQDLLEQSEDAFAAVETYRLGGRMTMETPFGQFGFEVSGAVDQRNDAFSWTLRSNDVPGVPAMTMVARDGVMWMNAGGRWERLDVPRPEFAGVEQFDVLPYVKDVQVDEGHVVAGESAVKITGILDGGSLAEGLLEGVPSELSAEFGDTRVVLYLSEASHLPLRMLMDQSAEIGGERADMQVDFAFTDVNEPVEIPRPGA